MERKLQSKIEINRKLELERVKRQNKICYFLISITLGLSTISDLAIQFFYKSKLNLEPADLARMTSFIMLPWMIKPIFGLVTDLCPLFGYRRKTYIIICGLVNMMAWWYMAYYVNSVFSSNCTLFLVNVTLSFLSVLGEAVVVELSNLDKIEGSESSHEEAKNYVSYFFLFKYVGSLSVALLKGYLISIFTLSTIFLITSAISLITIISGIILIERNFDKQIHREMLPENEGLTSISTTASPENVPLANIQLPTMKKENLFYQFLTFLTQKFILIPTTFIIVFMATPSYSDAMFYFFTDKLNLNAVDLGIISFFSRFSGMCGVMLYRSYFKRFKFKSLLIGGTLVSFFFSFLAYIQVTRLNVVYGIPDFMLVVFTSSFMTILGEIIIMPMLSLACMLCPKNLEATAYSVFMSAINLGDILSGLFGSWLMTYYNITKTSYSNLPNLILVSNVLTLMPLLALFFINKSYFDPEVKPEAKKLDQELQVAASNKI